MDINKQVVTNQEGLICGVFTKVENMHEASNVEDILQ
jgi:hypothetical protein